MSLPVRGAWIEMERTITRFKRIVSLPVRGAWIEMSMTGKHADLIVSLPVRGAWIEISYWQRVIYDVIVAPRAGSVD